MEITIGMGCSIVSGSDRKAGTVVGIIQVGKSQVLKVQEDKSIRISGFAHDGSIEYQYSRDPDGYVMYFKQDTKGHWIDACRNSATGRWQLNRCKTLGLGGRSTYRDPHF